jgi:transposase InsO family protein
VFEQDWPDIEVRLQDAPELEARALFENLMTSKPDVYKENHLRTFQRRVKVWRALHGPDKEVFFPQIHRAGEAMQTDFTWTTELGVTILGVPFVHMLCHTVLPYSNWEWATVCQSESMLALRRGIPAALVQMGCVPEWHQTDNSTSATHTLADGKRGFNDAYVELMKHYEMKPRTIGIGKSEQNGDVESLNGVLKRRLKQHLLLRGSRGFASVEAWECFVQDVCRSANARRQEKFAEDLAAMRPLAAAPFKDFDELTVKVSQESTILVRRNLYSVPSRLIGERLHVRLSEMRMEVRHAGIIVLETDRVIGESRHRIDYRHIIGPLMRKTGAFERYRHREDLFPGLTWRMAYDALQKGLGNRKGEVEYLRLLHLSAHTLESEVHAALEVILEAGRLQEATLVKDLMGCEKPVKIPDLLVPNVDLSEYDVFTKELMGVAV